MTVEERSACVKDHAAVLGFDACGIARAGAIDPEDRLGAWLARGFHADMRWMETTKAVRQDVRRKLSGAQSVVVVARNYFAERPDAADGTGCVSRYAWRRDYHRVLRKPMAELAEAIAALKEEGGKGEEGKRGKGIDLGRECYICVDTGPVMERAWAAAAGVGWIGKNSLAIRADMGSWFFLGVIVTTLELVPDAPAEDRCGTCTRCMEACPTGAIVAPRVVDARRCIAYHTIENRGVAPEELQPRFGVRVFGCDACQEACPWNRFARETTEKDFHPRQGHANPDLAAWSAMDEAAFNREFAGTPIRRATYPGLQRNLRIATANAQRRPGFPPSRG